MVMRNELANQRIVQLTIFTPTFNRAYCLPRAYESLCRQTCREFEWLVIDDGSTDNTPELLRQWQEEGRMPIRYIRQENQGMHGAHNTAFRNIDTELCLCLDSDDMLTDDCVEYVLKFWADHAAQHEQVAGCIARDGYISGGFVGTPFPEGVEVAHYNWLIETQGKIGDVKYVFRTEVARAAPEYPVFPDEKYGSMAYKNQFIDARYPWLLIERVIYLVEYMADGASHNMYQLYRDNPKGWDMARRSSMLYSLTRKRKFMECVHYVSNSIFLHKWNFVADSPLKLYTVLAIPFGVALHAWIRFKTSHS